MWLDRLVFAAKQCVCKKGGQGHVNVRAGAGTSHRIVGRASIILIKPGVYYVTLMSDVDAMWGCRMKFVIAPF